MSWPQWPGGGTAQPGLVAPLTTPLINPTPAVVNPSNIAPTGVPYTAEQWAHMQQQNWQQWAQWQQQFQQWQQQYGAQYAKTLSALTSQTPPTLQPNLPSTSVPPPLPTESKPPPPPEEPPSGVFSEPSVPAYSGYTTAPSNPSNYTTTTASQPRIGYSAVNQPPPGYQTHSRVGQLSETISDNRPGYTGNFDDNRWQNQGFHRNSSYNQPVTSQPTNFSKPPPKIITGDVTARNDFGNKRPYNQPPNYGDPKKSRFQQEAGSAWPLKKEELIETGSTQQKPSAQTNIEELSEAEKKFDKQFAEWEAQFQKWKEQNANHPDKAQYKEYEKKWENWRAQLLERREQMRRKRLGLLGDPKLAQNKPNQAKGQIRSQTEPATPHAAPSTEPQTEHSGSRSILTATDENKQNSVSEKKLPSDLKDEQPQPNDLPQNFVNNENDLLSHEKGDGSAPFLKPANTDGIPGLDLVVDNKDDEPDDTVNTKNVNVPDLAAISKGLDSILGDAKFMNILNMVSKNQTVQPPPVGMALSKISDSHSQSQERPNDNARTEGQQYEETSMNSFTDDSNLRGNDNARDVPEVFGQHEYNADPNRKLNNYNNPQGFANSFGPNLNQNTPGSKIFNYGQGCTNDANNFRRGNEGINNRNDAFGRGRVVGDFDNLRRFSFDSGNFNRGPEMESSNLNFNRASGNFDRNQGGFQRGNFQRDVNTFEKSPGGFDKNSRNFNTGPPTFNRGSGNFVGNVPGNLERNNRNFGRNSGILNESFSTDLNTPQSNFERNRFRREFEDGPGTHNTGNFGFERGPRPFENMDNTANLNRNFGRNADGFGRKGGFLKSDTLEKEYGGFDKDRNFDVDRRVGKSNFETITRGGPGVFRDERVNFDRRFDSENDQYRHLQKISGNFGPSEVGHELGRGPTGLGNVGVPQMPGNYENHENFRGGPGNFIKDDNFPRNQFESSAPLHDSFGNQPHLTIEPNLPIDPLPANDLPVIEEEEIWKPEMVIDYEHKSSKLSEFEVIVEPVHSFDYRHKPLNRIPLPQRPEWLKESLKNYSEFDFIITRSFEPQQLRRYPTNESVRSYDSYRKDDFSYERQKYEDKLFDRPSDRGAFESKRGYNDSRYDRKSVEDKRPFEDKRLYDRKLYEDMSSDDNFFSDEKVFYDRKRSSEDKLIFNERSFEKRRIHDDKRSYDEVDSKSFDRKSNDREDFNRRSFGSDSHRNVHSDRKLDSRRDNVSESVNPQYAKWSPPPAHEQMQFEDNAKQTPQNKNNNITLIEDILHPPGRYNRPSRIVIILRGPPGSGKTTLAKLIKDKEVENGGSAPRILSLDDYFMVEQEKEVIEDGRKVKVKDMVYEYEECMEASYRQSLMKAFKKTVTDGYFPFIIVDNVNEKVKYFGEMWSYAKQNGFQVYICQLELDVQTCTKRNIHGRTEAEIQKCVSGWETTPTHHPILDATSLIQSGSIPEVEMEEINSPPSVNNDESQEENMCRSKWDAFDLSQDNLAKLDGISKPLRPSKTMEDYLQLDDDWVQTTPSKPGQKRVRWADLEERKKQEKMRAIGFVVGHTNWDRMMDPTMGSSALTQTKFIERFKY
ncbi:YLP motif-containing protein 1-like isoform X2 [Agrilus planipennis]|uniref:YLP motif-containing protein 1 n=1 Tax=Agrilus planipennis TaxID=224129 RepID=A0A7F5R766_AGRPL|nr:YLP motif-containing protein 1-like isoform X2 [Agrilus planipennis]